MKYRELEVGQAYYSDPSNKWAQFNSGTRVIIDDLTRRSEGRWNSKGAPNPSGMYVLGHTQDADDPSRRGVVMTYRIAALRGLWDELSPRQNAIRAAQITRQQAAREAADASRTRMRSAAGRLGISGGPYSFREWIISVEDLESLAERIERLQP